MTVKSLLLHCWLLWADFYFTHKDDRGADFWWWLTYDDDDDDYGDFRDCDALICFPNLISLLRCIESNQACVQFGSEPLGGVTCGDREPAIGSQLN